MFCLCSFVYITDDPPRIILNKLEKAGYKVVGVAGIGQTCTWTMYAESENIPEQSSPTIGDSNIH